MFIELPAISFQSFENFVFILLLSFSLLLLQESLCILHYLTNIRDFRHENSADQTKPLSASWYPSPCQSTSIPRFSSLSYPIRVSITNVISYAFWHQKVRTRRTTRDLYANADLDSVWLTGRRVWKRIIPTSWW